jgi:hypothetical protein
MHFPTIPKDHTREIVQRFLDLGTLEAHEAIVWEGSGEDLDLSAVADLGEELEAALEQHLEGSHASDPDHFEGLASIQIHQKLANFPVEVLDNPGFWRFLTLEYFWVFTHWRERGAFASGDSGKWMPYVDATKSSECVPLRAYLRGQIAYVAGDYALASAVEEATDFWRSHIVRVRTWSTPTIARALIETHSERHMTTEPLRSLARRINRRRSSVVLHGYSDTEAHAAIAELRNAVEET